MDLGLFSISLAVKDLGVSREFYEKLGFEVTHAPEGQNYVILVNGTTVVGLFQGMFEKNILTFNPGLKLDGGQMDEFTDVRKIQAMIREAGLEPIAAADDSTEGAAHITLEDPDGNPILIDQFF